MLPLPSPRSRAQREHSSQTRESVQQPRFSPFTASIDKTVNNQKVGVVWIAHNQKLLHYYPCFHKGVARPSFPAPIDRAPPPPYKSSKLLVRGLGARRTVWLPPPPPLLRPRVARARRHPDDTPYTTKYCLTCSALNSVLLPAATTAPLAITT